MSSARSDHTGLLIGGEPRIDFLPPEVKAGKQARRTRRSLAGLVIIVLLACAAGYVFATTLSVQAQLRLGEEQARTQQLLSEQAKYAEARALAGELASVLSSQRAGSAAEILWADYLSALQSTLPAGTVIETFSVDSQTALESAPVPSILLQESRVATITFTALLPSLAAGDTLLINLRELRGFADATIGSISHEEGLYRANVVLNVNAEAFQKRFFEKSEEKPADNSTQSADADGSEGAESSDQTAEGEE